MIRENFKNSVLRQAAADHHSGEHVQRGEQGSGAVAFVVMGHRASPALLHRQGRLGAVQGLDLALLLVYAQHHGLLRRVQVQTHHVDELLLEVAVIGEFEGLHQMGLEPSRRPDPLHRRRAHPDFFAIDRHDQCVSPSGFECSVKSTISATFSSLIDGLRPRPLATSPNPISPSFSNWPRQASTVGRDTPTTSLISEFDTPSAVNSNTWKVIQNPYN